MPYVPVSLVEEFILNYSALPPELENWRYYRCELGGHAESCFMELPIYLPRNADAYILDLLFEFWQEKSHSRKRKKLHEIIQELERNLAWMDKSTCKCEEVQVNNTALEPEPLDEAQSE
jgi:hypothetical protein